jgi:putative endonuclease
MKIHHAYYEYIVECRDGFYYTGMSNDLDRRLWEHNTGYNPKCYTYRRRPVELQYCEYFSNVNYAIARERQIKGWSRKKKEALFKEDWNELVKLAKSKSTSEHDLSVLRPFGRLRVN